MFQQQLPTFKRITPSYSIISPMIRVHPGRLPRMAFLFLAGRADIRGFQALQPSRSRIQEESLLYERRKQSGERPIIGVNTRPGPAPEFRSVAASGPAVIVFPE